MGIVLTCLPQARATILRVVLTNLLTTTLGEHGREGNGEPGEQGRSDPLDGHGRL